MWLFGVVVLLVIIGVLIVSSELVRVMLVEIICCGWFFSVCVLWLLVI